MTQKQKPERWVSPDMRGSSAWGHLVTTALETISAQLDFLIEQNQEPDPLRDPWLGQYEKIAEKPDKEADND